MRFGWWFAACAIFWCGCSGGSADKAKEVDPSGLQEIKLALNWYPEAEHGGFIAAQVHGFFRDEGLRVEIQSGGPNAPVIQNTATGRVDFAVANADQVLMGRHGEAEVVALMAAMQDSPRCIMVHKKSGITSFDQLQNLTLAVGSGKPFFQYLKTKTELKGVKLVNYTGSIAAFLQDDRFAQQGYVFSEPFVARQNGAEPHCLMVSDTGFNPYTSLLIAHDRTVKEQPELVRKVVRACRKGWIKYLADPAKTNERIHELRNDMSIAALEFGAEALRPLCRPNNLPVEQVGQMSEARWKTLFEQLVEAGVLPADSGALKGAFTTAFLGSEEPPK